MAGRRTTKVRRSFIAVLQREGTGYVALCPELDVASQGKTVESATASLKEAVEFFLECAGSKEIRRRHRGEVFVTCFETVRG